MLNANVEKSLIEVTAKRKSNQDTKKCIVVKIKISDFANAEIILNNINIKSILSVLSVGSKFTMEEKGEKFGIAIDLRPVANESKSLYVIKEFLKQLEKLKILQVTDFSTNDKNLLVILGLAQAPLHNLRCGKCHQTGYFYQYPTIPGFGYDNIFCSECRG